MFSSLILCMHTGIRRIEQRVIRSAPICPYAIAPWLAPQQFITEQTSLNASFVESRRGTNHVVGQVLSVRLFSMSWISGSKSTLHPSASCSTGPSPLTIFTLSMVIGIPPLVRKLLEKPPPLKYPRSAGYHVVAFRQSFTSFSVISQ